MTATTPAAEPLIVSYSGIRGVVGASLTEEVAARFGRAFGRLVRERHPRPTVLLGRDTRPSGPALLAGVVRGLAPLARLVDLGVVPTPTVQLAIGALGADAAVCVTASHNPARWNGLKLFLGPERTVLDGEQMRAVAALAAAEPEVAPEAGPPPALEVRRDEAIRRHLEAVLSHVDAARVRARAFRVALDAGGGAGEEPALALLAALGCDVIVVRSARESEPVPEHLGELRRAVVEERCDLGLAQDLDADRLALVTERGDAPGEEATLVLAVEHLLRRTAGGERCVVRNVATTRAVDEVAARHGARIVETPVGEANLSRALLREAALGRVAFGGEGNGGIIYPPVMPGRDSLVGTALVLESLAGDLAPLSRRLEALPRHHGRKVRVPLAPGAPVPALLARVEAAFPDGRVDRLDGLGLRFDDGAWLVARASNTEPILRIVAEAGAPRRVEELVARAERALAGPPA